MTQRKVLLALFVFLAFLFIRPSFASASLKDCFDEACEAPSGSASQFFMEDANDLEAIADLPPIPTSGKFWPVDGIITGRFGKWRGGKKHGHYHVGVDIAAPYGSKIVAPLDGVVEFIGKKGAYGLTVIVDHGDDIATLYAHNSEVFVKEGQQVIKGQLLSKIGMTGRSTGPHLHYEVRVDGQPVSPLAWTDKLQMKRL